MRMLSLSRPWGWAIFDAEPVELRKPIENRSWPPPISMIGHRIALQAAKSWDDNAISMFIRLGLDGFPNRKDLYPSGVILGFVTIHRVVTEARTLTPQQRMWFFDSTPDEPNYGWILSDVLKLATPIPCKGAQGLRELPDESKDQVLAAFAKQWPNRCF